MGTRTPVNGICVRILEKFMKDMDYKIHDLQEISGYFLEEEKFTHHYAIKEFVKDISLLYR